MSHYKCVVSILGYSIILLIVSGILSILKERKEHIENCSAKLTGSLMETRAKYLHQLLQQEILSSLKKGLLTLFYHQ